MPAANQHQANLARMAMALLHGHRLEGVSKTGVAKARQMVEMGEAKLKDFLYTKKSPKDLLHRGRDDEAGT